MGHSMGGIVAVSLLPSRHISLIVTMSTPHTLAPLRLDSRIAEIYARNSKILETDPTPILSICGGATDMMILSEACVLPTTSDAYRRTVFTSGTDGIWTGVGHREMVWCHQVRWRIARVALDCSALHQPQSISEAIARSFKDDTSTSESALSVDRNILQYSAVVDSTTEIKLQNAVVPSQGSIFTMNMETRNFVIYAPRSLVTVEATSGIPISGCEYEIPTATSTTTCLELKPIIQYLPNPAYGMFFPVPDQGSDEFDGVAMITWALQKRTNLLRIHLKRNTTWLFGASYDPRAVVLEAWTIGAFP